MALAGEWQTVSERPVGAGQIGRKRKHGRDVGDVDEEEEEAKKEAEKFVSKGWGSRVKQYPGAAGDAGAGDDDADLDALLESTKDINKVKGENDEGGSKDSVGKVRDGGVSAQGDRDPAGANIEGLPGLKEEGDGEPGATPQHEPEDATGGVVFKKRKPKVMRR